MGLEPTNPILGRIFESSGIHDNFHTNTATTIAKFNKYVNHYVNMVYILGIVMTFIYKNNFSLLTLILFSLALPKYVYADECGTLRDTYSQNRNLDNADALISCLSNQAASSTSKWVYEDTCPTPVAGPVVAGGPKPGPGTFFEIMNLLTTVKTKYSIPDQVWSIAMQKSMSSQSDVAILFNKDSFESLSDISGTVKMDEIVINNIPIDLDVSQYYISKKNLDEIQKSVIDKNSITNYDLQWNN